MMMKFLFFGNRYADMTEFVVRDLGHVRFQSFDQEHLSVQFETRKDVDDTLMISLMKETFDILKNDLPPEEIFDWFMNWQVGVSGNLSPKSLPSYHLFVLTGWCLAGTKKNAFSGIDVFISLPTTRLHVKDVSGFCIIWVKLKKH